mmetsp:Transcript_57924/g.137881  ORF Transcript_57924/g.137881 Transcript_57924/m.137881 type:complete len:1025 (+) Transcript_57924:90-3164(+)
MKPRPATLEDIVVARDGNKGSETREASKGGDVCRSGGITPGPATPGLGIRSSVSWRPMSSRTTTNLGSEPSEVQSSRTTQIFKAGCNSTVVRSLDYTISQANKRSGRYSSADSYWILTPRADLFFGLVIVLHAIVLGVDIEASLASPSGTPEGAAGIILLILEISFTIVFTVELALRCRALGLRYLCTLGGAFDAILVLIAMFDLLVKIINGANPTRGVGAFRVIRLLRLVRIARLLHIFPELQLLISGLVGTLFATFWAVVLIALFCYVGALICADILGRSSDSEVSDYFGSVGLSYLSQVQISMVEAWPDVAEAMMRESSWWAYYVVFFIIVANFAMLNVVTGVVCDQVLALASRRPPQKPAERQRKMDEIRAELGSLFNSLKLNAEGRASTLACAHLLEEPEAQRILQKLGLGLPLQRSKLCTLIDSAGAGELSLEEFVKGVLRLRGTEDDRITLPLQHSIISRGQQVAKQSEELEDRFRERVRSSLLEADKKIMSEVEGVRRVLDQLVSAHHQPAALRADASSELGDEMVHAVKILHQSLSSLGRSVQKVEKLDQRKRQRRNMLAKAEPETRSTDCQTMSLWTRPVDKGFACCFTRLYQSSPLQELHLDWTPSNDHRGQLPPKPRTFTNKDLERLGIDSETPGHPLRAAAKPEHGGSLPPQRSSARDSSDLKRSLSTRDRRRLGVAHHDDDDASDAHPLRGLDLDSVTYPLVPHRGGELKEHWGWKRDGETGRLRWHHGRGVSQDGGMQHIHEAPPALERLQQQQQQQSPPPPPQLTPQGQGQSERPQQQQQRRQSEPSQRRRSGQQRRRSETQALSMQAQSSRRSSTRATTENDAAAAPRRRSTLRRSQASSSSLAAPSTAAAASSTAVVAAVAAAAGGPETQPPAPARAASATESRAAATTAAAATAAAIPAPGEAAVPAVAAAAAAGVPPLRLSRRGTAASSSTSLAEEQEDAQSPVQRLDSQFEDAEEVEDEEEEEEEEEEELEEEESESGASGDTPTTVPSSQHVYSPVSERTQT